MKIENNFIIGALHFNPLVGYKGYENYDSILEKAKEDLFAFEKGGVHAVIIENNYNLPHKIKETNEAVDMMIRLGKDLSLLTRLPLGVSLLWNDFENAFKIAKSIGAKFIRVPVFVDSVKTDFGEIYAEPKKVLKERNAADAEDILIFADIQVKHAEMIRERGIENSALDAIENGADALIITGKWTGDAPLIKDLKKVRKSIGDEFTIIIGSGADRENVKELLAFANSAIVSTSLKEGYSIGEERNLKPFRYKIDSSKVRKFMDAVNND
jgi:hypothetical protein